MSENSESEVEVDPYEEIVGLNLNYSTPMGSIILDMRERLQIGQ